MDDTLLKRYLEYARSEESFAVLFVKEQLAQAKGHWVDILNCRCYYKSSDPLHFKFVNGGLYRRTIRPKYPPREAFSRGGTFDERGHCLAIRAITWDAAHKDIQQQKSMRAPYRRFKITGWIHDLVRTEMDFFRDDAPPEIKALASNLNDRTNPLWDRALQYANKQESVYEAKLIYLA